MAMYDYEAAADDEISFDPDDIITHIEMVKIYFRYHDGINTAIHVNFFFRSMKDGGVVCVKENMVFSLRIMFNCNSNFLFFLLIFVQ